RACRLSDSSSRRRPRPDCRDDRTGGPDSGSAPDEAAAARTIIEAALALTLKIRARAAWHAGKCRRETPIAWQEPDGIFMEGVLDLALEEQEAWMVIDFKTNIESEGALKHYRRQVALYAAA